MKPKYEYKENIVDQIQKKKLYRKTEYHGEFAFLCQTFPNSCIHAINVPDFLVPTVAVDFERKQTPLVYFNHANQ